MLAAPVCAAGPAAARVANPDPELIARWEPCEPNSGVTVIVDDGQLGAEKVYVGCALGEQPDALEALEHAGFAPEGTASYGFAFICRIDGEPTPGEQACATTPPANAYWSYWRGQPGGKWSYSSFGSTSPKTRSPVNSVDGWSFGEGKQPRLEPLDGGGASPYLASFQPQALSFAARLAGSLSPPSTAALTNDDPRPLPLGTLETVGMQAGDFTVVGDTCAGHTLGTGESCEVAVSFDPGATGAREAVLQAAIEGSSQKLELPLAGTGTAASVPPETPPGSPGGSPPPNQGSSPPATQGTLGFSGAVTPRVGSLRLDGQGAGRGLVGVSWQVLSGGSGLTSWTVAARVLGSAGGYVSGATGTGSATSALVKLPPGFAYELQITFTGALGQSTTMSVGRVLVPHDARWSGLRYRGRWQRRTVAGAWLNTVTRAGAGAQVSAQLPPGRPVFALRPATRSALVEVRYGSHRQLYTLTRVAGGVWRELIGGPRAKAGSVSLRVLHGTVDLDGVAVEG